MFEQIKYDRRRFLSTAAMAIAAASLGGVGSADAGIGHNLPQEAPQAFAEAVVEIDGY
jgi:hypothetical protein